jgi:hypothetical protein
MCAGMLVGLHIKCLLLLYSFNKHFNVAADFSEGLCFKEIVSAVLKLLHVESWMDRQI